MCCCIVTTRDTASHITISRTWSTCITEGTVWRIVVVNMDMMAVPDRIPTWNRTPPPRVISPIIRRMPAYPTRSPEPIVNNRTVDKNRFNHIVLTIDIFIANHLYRHVIRGFITLYKNRSNVLIDVLRQNGLQNDKALVAFPRFYHTKIVNFTIAIQVQIRVSRIRIVEQSLKLLKISRLRK